MANKLTQNGWKNVSFYFSSFYPKCYHFSWRQLLTGQVWAAPLQNKLAATEKIANFGWGIVSLPHKSESGQQKTTWALNILTVQVIDGSIWSLVPSCTLLITVHSGAIQSAGQGLHSLKKRKKKYDFAHCKGFWIPESEKFLLVESGIQLKESGIPLMIGIQNPGSTDRD